MFPRAMKSESIVHNIIQMWVNGERVDGTTLKEWHNTPNGLISKWMKFDFDVFTSKEK